MWRRTKPFGRQALGVLPAGKGEHGGPKWMAKHPRRFDKYKQAFNTEDDIPCPSLSRFPASTFSKRSTS